MTRHTPQVSIVLATRDRPQLAEEALRGALRQTFQDLEVVVVDDGSNPPLRLDEADPRISLVRLPRSRGVSAARNAGLAAATGRWVTFLDDDDEMLPELLELSLQAAARSSLAPPVAVVSGLEIVSDDGKIKVVRLPMSLPKGKDYFLEGAQKGRALTVGNTLVIPRTVLLGIGGFDEELRSAVHSELFLRINAVCSIEGVPLVTYRIKRHQGPSVHGNLLAKAEAMELTAKKHAQAFARHPRNAAQFLSSTGLWYLKAGAWGAAVRMTWRALWMDPKNPKVVRSFMATLGGPAMLGSFRWAKRWLGGRRRRQDVR